MTVQGESSTVTLRGDVTVGGDVTVRGDVHVEGEVTVRGEPAPVRWGELYGDEAARQDAGSQPEGGSGEDDVRSADPSGAATQPLREDGTAARSVGDGGAEEQSPREAGTAARSVRDGGAEKQPVRQSGAGTGSGRPARQESAGGPAPGEGREPGGRRDERSGARQEPVVGKPIDTEALRRLRKLAASADPQPSAPTRGASRALPGPQTGAAPQPDLPAPPTSRTDLPAPPRSNGSPVESGAAGLGPGEEAGGGRRLAGERPGDDEVARMQHRKGQPPRQVRPPLGPDSQPVRLIPPVLSRSEAEPAQVNTEPAQVNTEPEQGHAKTEQAKPESDKAEAAHAEAEHAEAGHAEAGQGQVASVAQAHAEGAAAPVTVPKEGAADGGPTAVETTVSETAVSETTVSETVASETAVSGAVASETAMSGKVSSERVSSESGLRESAVREGGSRESTTRETGPREVEPREAARETGHREAELREVGPREIAPQETAAREGGAGWGGQRVVGAAGNREGRVRRVESVVGRDSGGWRRIAQVVVGGGGVRSDGSEIDEARARAVFSGSRRIVVLGCTGGAGQSTTALMLGHTLARHRDDKVIAVDANTGGETMTSRVTPETPETLASLLAGLDHVGGYLSMRGYTTRTASGLEVIGADTDADAERRMSDRTLFSDHRLGQAIHLLDRHYKLTVIDPAAALAARVLPYADQLVLVVPASEEAAEAVAMTYEWLDGHGCADLRRRAVMVVNGVSRRSMSDVEQAEAVARGRCRAIVRVPWEDDLAPGGAEIADPGQLRAAGRRAYLALAGVVVAGFAAQSVRVSEEELASDPPGTRIGER
ncbi:hypothetical protein [Nonomuraea sp. NPDC050405]|uniref:hypothetical protein n=1 Tax=Nonomuraea sp. NPDC050405 TaxID=3154509 RepID=UPI0033E1083B